MIDIKTTEIVPSKHEGPFVCVDKNKFMNAIVVKFWSRSLRLSHIEIATNCLNEAIIDSSETDILNSIFKEKCEIVKLFAEKHKADKLKKILELQKKVDKLENCVFDLKIVRAALLGAILLIAITMFCSPVPVMVGDVCLSCWGK